MMPPYAQVSPFSKWTTVVSDSWVTHLGQGFCLPCSDSIGSKTKT